MVGQNIGKYRVLDRIGRGGMGTVYRAMDETLHRDVAIKVLNAELNDPEVAKRFRAEAITVARLSHPGIATIYELFQNDGQWLMVMEFVRGETLEHMVDRMGPLSPQRTAELSMQALAALAHAHSMGVVHRDLKPANIMITETGAIKIMDFGIARVAGTEHLTNAGFMMGTPAYMAPEQVMGHEIDARADLYAMGVVFYRLTTAKLPFKGDTPFAMAQSQVNDPPTPIGVVRSDLPSWVEQLMVRALAKNPEERFQSAVDFHESLARCLAGLPMRPADYNSSAPTELLMTPPRAMPTGSIRSNLPPLTGAPPPPSGTQPLVTPSAVNTSGPVSVPVPAAPLADFDASAATMLSPSPSGPVPVSGPLSGPVIAQASMSAAIPASAPVSAAIPVATPTESIPAASATAATPVAPVATESTATNRMAPDKAAPPAKKSSAGILALVGVLVVAAIGGGLWFKSRQQPAQPVAVTDTPAPVTPPPATDVAPPAAADAAASAPDASTAATSSTTPPTAPSTTVASTPATGARARGAARASTPAATTTPTAATPAAPVIDDTPKSFDQARLMLVKGRKTDDEDITLWFANGHVNAVTKKGQQSLGALPYASVVGATYLRARDPKWNAEFASPPSNLDVGGMLRSDKNWLVVQSRESYLIFRLDDSNSRTILQTLAERTGVAISYPKTEK